MAVPQSGFADDETARSHARTVLIDIGVNLADHAFDGDRDAVIARAAEAGVRRMIVTGTNVEQSRRALELARERKGVLFATAGVHPHDAKRCDASTIDDLAALLREPDCVAVGETGLDFFRDLSPRSVQLDWFEAQLALAADCGKPAFLHEREAMDGFLEVLRRWRDRLCGAVAHCFTGERAALHAYRDLDLHIGITGWICDERRGVELQSLVRDIDPARLLIETDAPYLLPRTLRPKPATRRNEPRWLPEVCRVVASCVGVDEHELAAITTHNAERLFALPVRSTG